MLRIKKRRYVCLCILTGAVIFTVVANFTSQSRGDLQEFDDDVIVASKEVRRFRFGLSLLSANEKAAENDKNSVERKDLMRSTNGKDEALSFVSLPKTPLKVGYMEQRPADSDESEKSPATAELRRLYRYNLKLQGKCEDLKYISNGSAFETYKAASFPVCFDSKHWNASKYQSDCLVYSYGIDNDWGFDDAMAAIHGCDVHTFDANMYSTSNHRRSRKVWFHKIAIGAQTANKVYLKGKRDYIAREERGFRELEVVRMVKMRTLWSAMRELGHEKNVLNVFRVDGEGPNVSYEINILKNLLEEGIYRCIRQMSFEMHFFGPFDNDMKVDELIEKFSVLKSLEVVGFLLLDTQISSRSDVTNEDKFVEVLTEKSNSVVMTMLWINTEPNICIPPN